MTNLKKKLKKRWGRKFKDHRDWKTYNRQLVKRGEYLLDLDWIQGWNNELEEMNRNKVGKPFKFPNSLIQVQGVWHSIMIPYRMIQGITMKLVEIADLPASNHYSTVNRRVNGLDIQLELSSDHFRVLAGDGSGFQAVSGGEYLREKYGKKNRRWIQLIILGDPETKEPVSFEVNVIPSSEPDSVKDQFDELIEKGVKVDEFKGDGGFDKIDLWKYFEEKRVQPTIKPDKNARVDSDSSWRNINARYRKDFGYEDWAKRTKYGLRWVATEGIFSAIKRMFGEQLAGKSEIGMVQEAKLKVWSYVALKRYGEA
jgi:hypothetical protein